MRIELVIEERHCGPYSSGFNCPISRALTEIVRPNILIKVEYYLVKFIIPQRAEPIVLDLGKKVKWLARVFDSFSWAGTQPIPNEHLPVTLHIELPEYLVFGPNLLDMTEI